VLGAGEAFLRVADPLLPFMNNGMVMVSAAMLEFVCFVLIWKTFAGNIGRQLMVILWCGSVFAVYRLGLVAMDYQGPCRCLGNLGSLMGLDHEWINKTALIILGYMLVPGSIMLYWCVIKGSHVHGASCGVRRKTALLYMAVLMMGAVQQSSAAAHAHLAGHPMAGTNGVLNIEGWYEYENYILPRPNNIEYESHGCFQIWLKGPYWSIFYNSQSALTNKHAFYHQEYSLCNDQGVYIIKRRNPGSLSTTNRYITTEAVIYSGFIPPPFERDTYNLWITMIAPRVWTNATGLGYAPKISDVSMFYHTNALSEYQYFDGGGEAWFRKLVFKEEGTIFGRDVHKKAALRRIALPPPYTNGYELATVRWFKETNKYGAAIPISADYRFFVPVENALSANQLATCYLANIFITNITINVRDNKPSLLENGEVAYVVDYRFQDKGVAALTYTATNSFPARNDKQLELLARAFPKSTLETMVLSQLGFAPVSPWKGIKIYLARALFIAVIAFPLLVFVRARLKKQEDKIEKGQA